MLNNFHMIRVNDFQENLSKSQNENKLITIRKVHFNYLKEDTAGINDKSSKLNVKKDKNFKGNFFSFNPCCLSYWFEMFFWAMKF